MDATTEIPTTRINTLFPFLVILTLAIPGILIFWSDYNSPKSTENRSLAPRPALPDNWKDYKTFPTRFQQYVDDHFGFRNTFLSLHNRLQYQVWGTPVLQPGESANPLINQAAAARISNEVLIGRDGWLFFKGDRLLDDARGLRPFSKRDLVEWSNAFKRNQEQLASLGIGYIVVFTPN
ncbi:MAG: hypothetical protein KDA65_11795, partial [Planctomycetaceae bacterium]|nr:hypothetical protein [Planctomycetaceae bacterium]